MGYKFYDWKIPFNLIFDLKTVAKCITSCFWGPSIVILQRSKKTIWIVFILNWRDCDWLKDEKGRHFGIGFLNWNLPKEEPKIKYEYLALSKNISFKNPQPNLHRSPLFDDIDCQKQLLGAISINYLLLLLLDLFSQENAINILRIE